MLRLVIVLVAVVVVSARKSPNHEYIEELIRQTPPGNKSIDILQLALLDVPDLVREYGYPSEAHQVITEDGYILEAHRIPYGKDGPSSNRPVVFLMHGMLSSSADFLIMGPGQSLGYLLADQGYDVWLGNARGNYYSRNHVTLNPDSDLDFWKFSWDEIGNLDLPALIDYVLKVTGQQKLHYIGHSQGGTSFLVLNSLRPEYNEKFITFQGLAPASFFTHNESPIFKALAPYESVLETVAFRLGIREVLPRKCHEPTGSLGSQIEYLICNFMKSGDENSEDIQILRRAHTPAGASIRQFRHYGQCIKYDSFRRLYHDPITNLKLYRSFTPPVYDVSKITVPTYLHYGLADVEVNYRDVYTLASKLPNVVLNEITDPSFAHTDFLAHANILQLLYNDLVNILKKFD